MKVKISGFTDEAGSKLSDQIALVKSLGESYMCPRNIDGKSIADYTLDEFKEKVYPILKKEGIKFSSIGSPIGKVGIEDEEGWEKQKKQLVELVKIAQLMKCQYIRVFSFFYGKKVAETYTDKVIERMKEMLAIVKGSGVKLLHENEKLVYGDVPSRILTIYNALNDEDLVLCFDASNFVQCDVNPQEAFEQLKDYVVYYHIKDCSEYKVEVPVGVGKGCYPYILGELAKRNYNGFMTLEPHTFKYAVLKGLIYFIPFMPLIKRNYYKAFRLIDKSMHRCFFQCASLKTVYRWQYENLKKLLSEVNK